MSEHDYFKILGLPADAGYREIEQAYWSRVSENRASLDTVPDALRDLNEAYEVLRTPALRERYEASRTKASGETPVRPPSNRLVPSVGRHLPWRRPAAAEPAAQTAVMVERLQREVRAERERMRAVFDVDLEAQPATEGQSPMQRVFGRLRLV